MSTSSTGGEPTVASIAAACGVSAMTVSRALRMDASVAPATRRRVLAAAEKAGYRLNVNQGRPRRKTSRKRGVVQVILGTAIAPQSQFSAQLLIGIEQELGRRGCDCVIRTCNGVYSEFVALCEAVRQSPAAGTLIVGHVALDQLRTLLELAPRAILVDNEGDPRLPFSPECVSYDNVEAARLALRHLAELGRRRVLLLTGPAEHYFARRVEQGYRETLSALGLAVDDRLIRATDYTSAGARKAILDLLAEGLDFDGVFTNDEMAAGVLRALHEAGRRVPGDVAVAGCDGLPIGEVTIPRLTTVALEGERMGRLAVARVLRGGDEPDCRIQLLPKLVVRESTGGATTTLEDRR